MRKLLFTLLIFPASFCLLDAQHTFLWEAHQIKFSYHEKLDFVDTEDPKDVYWELDNLNISIGIEAVPFEEESQAFLSNVEYAAEEIAIDMEIQSIEPGDSLQLVKNGYFVIGKDRDYDDSLYPVLIGAIVVPERQMAFEITVDCYDKNIEHGIALIQSLHFTKEFSNN